MYQNEKEHRDYSCIPNCSNRSLCVLSRFDTYTYIYIYIYDIVKSKRRHWLAVTLSFTPCGDRQTDFYSIYIYTYIYISKVFSVIFKECSTILQRQSERV